MKSSGRASKQKKGIGRVCPQAQPLASKPQAPNALGGGTIDNPKRALEEAIRIVIVDDHPLFRHGLAQLINSDDGFAVCGEAGSAPEALTLIRKIRPHLVIVDLSLKGPGGLE